MEKQVKNPFVSNSPVKLVCKIPTDYLIKSYKDLVAIEYLFSELDEVLQYECKKSGFRFFYPYRITGDSKFYEKLQEYDWYYMAWKWENEYCQKYIKDGDHILDVGSGQGSFLKKIGSQNRSLNCYGLELNETAVYKKDNVEVVNQTIEDFSTLNENRFDVVCSFQVLEHIPQVFSFLKGKVRALKKGGYLMIAVPNRDSDFLILQEGAFLDMPPHHMGHWHEQSLREIGALFNLEIVEIVKEPLQKQHYLPHWYSTLNARYGSLVAKICNKFINVFRLSTIVENRMAKKAKNITGHTILAVYQKK